jgi:hypothetical protein
MIRVLMAIDEDKDMAQVAREVGMNMTLLRETLNKLLDLMLIELVEKKLPSLDREFLGAMRKHLAQAIGPMAELLIEDSVSDMGLSMGEIPVQRAAELISSISREIPDEAARLQFQRSMIELIPK